MSTDPLDEQIKQEQLAAAVAARKKAEAEQAEAEAKAASAKAAADKAEKDAAGDPESDPEVVEARKQARLAALAKDQATSEAASRQAAVPALPTIAAVPAEVDKSPKVEADSGKGTATLVAAVALDITGQEIGRAVRAALKGPATIWVVDYLDVARRRVERSALMARLEAFSTLFATGQAPREPDQAAPEEDEFESMGVLPVGEAASLAVGIGTGLAKFGVELVGAIRSRYAFYGRAVDLNRSALVGSVTRAFLNPVDATVTVKWPTLSPVGDSQVIGAFSLVCRQRDEYAAKYVLIQVEPDDKDGKERQRYAKSIVDAFDAFATAITEAPDDGSPSSLVAAALADLSVPLTDDSPQNYLLQVDITEQGADAMLGYGLAHGTTASFLGFVQAYYFLAKPDGTVIAGGTVTNRQTGRLNVKDARVDFPAQN